MVKRKHSRPTENQEPKRSIKYSLASREVERMVAKGLKSRRSLSSAKFLLLFDHKPLPAKGRVSMGKTIKASPLVNAIFYSALKESIDIDAPNKVDFIMILNHEMWLKKLTVKQREALVDHQLCHCGWDVEKGASVVPHDFEGFESNVRMHGAWTGEYEKAGRAFKQLKLPFPDAKEVDVKIVDTKATKPAKNKKAVAKKPAKKAQAIKDAPTAPSAPAVPAAPRLSTVPEVSTAAVLDNAAAGPKKTG